MNTTIALDPQIKSRALLRAKQDQLSISAVMRLLLLDYAEGRLGVGIKPLLTENGLTHEEELELLKLEKEARAGENISGPFEDMSSIRAHLKTVA